MNDRSTKTILKVLGLVLLAWIASRKVDFGDLARDLSSLALLPAIGLLAVGTVDRFLMAAKWMHLGRAIRIPAPFREYVAAYYAASFLSYFFPSSLGGDVYRGYRISRSTREGSSVIASLVMEKMTGVLAVISFAWTGLIYLIATGVAPDSRPVFLALLAFSCAALAVFFVSLHPWTHRMLTRVSRKLPVAKTIGKLSGAYAEYSSRKGTVVANTMLAILEAAIRLGITYGSAVAIGLDVPALPFCAIIAATEFIRRCTIVLDGWGLSESIRIVTYGLIGVSGSDALAVGLVSHAIMATSGLPGAVVFFTDPRRQEARTSEPRPGWLGKVVRRFLTPGFVVSLWYYLRCRTRISPRAEVELSPNLRFGRKCTVSSFTKIKATEGPLRIGDRSGFATGCFVSSGAAGIEIGSHVLCGPNVSVVGSNYVHDAVDVPFEEQGHDSLGIRIGNNVWIGAGSVVADGSVIGDNTIVVANSLVTRRYPPNVIISGSPAKVILRRDRAPGGAKQCATKSSTSSGQPSATSTTS